jgi:hypothetical protein
MSVSFLCSLAADLCLAQFLRYTLDLGSAVENTILEFCMYTHKTAISPLKRNPNCPCDHTLYAQACSLHKISELSLAEIARFAGYDRKTALTGASFRIGNINYYQKGFCNCRQNRSLKRFFPPDKWVGRCSSCSDNIFPHPFYTFKNVPAALIADQLDCRLGELGVEAENWVMLRGTAQSLLLIST